MEEVLKIGRAVFWVLCMLSFFGICYWAFSRHTKAGFDEAAQLPLADDDDLPASPADRKE
jgi:cytochrome c oxidase cbb3-type subunit 4